METLIEPPGDDVEKVVDSKATPLGATPWEALTEVRREEALLKTGALQNAIFNSANFSSIATDAKGVIQIFNVGAERMLGYAAADVVNRITPADISDPQEVIARAKALSIELSTPISPGFEALVFKASRGIEDIYELTYIRKDGSRFPAVVSVTALRDAQGAIIGYLLIGTDNTARKEIEAEQRQLAQRLRDQQFYTRSLFESNTTGTGCFRACLPPRVTLLNANGWIRCSGKKTTSWKAPSRWRKKPASPNRIFFPA